MEQAKTENEIIARMVQAQYGSPSHSAFVEKHMGEYLAKWPAYKDKLTHLEWYHLFLDAVENYDSETASERDRLKEEYNSVVHSLNDSITEINRLKEQDLLLREDRDQYIDLVCHLSGHKTERACDEYGNPTFSKITEEIINSLKEENERLNKQLDIKHSVNVDLKIQIESIKSKIQSLHKGESNDLMDKGWNEAIEHITKNIL